MLSHSFHKKFVKSKVWLTENNFPQRDERAELAAYTFEICLLYIAFYREGRTGDARRGALAPSKPPLHILRGF